jgi:hypothetical protein
MVTARAVSDTECGDGNASVGAAGDRMVVILLI